MYFISGKYPLIFPQSFEYSLLKLYEVEPRLKETIVLAIIVMIITITSDDVCYLYFINGLLLFLSAHCFINHALSSVC